MEIEVKVLEIDKEKIRQRLQAIGCQPISHELQMNQLYDFPDNRLDQADGSYIRLRSIYNFLTDKKHYLLTLKETVSRQKYKIAEETETIVADFDAMHTFLLKLGFHQTRTDEKIRETYQWDTIIFEIDEWAGLPPYLEVEATNEEAVKKGLEMVGYSLQESTSQNLREVLMMYGIKSSNLRFSDFGRNPINEFNK